MRAFLVKLLSYFGAHIILFARRLCAHKMYKFVDLDAYDPEFGDRQVQYSYICSICGATGHDRLDQ